MKIFLVLIFLQIVLNKKSKLEKKRELARPNGIDDQLYCLSCIIPIKKINKSHKPTYKELEILDIVTESCEQKKGFYNTFKDHYKASMIKDACNLFIHNWEDELIKNTEKLGYYNRSNLSRIVCIEITQSCKDQEAHDKIENIYYDSTGEERKTDL